MVCLTDFKCSVYADGEMPDAEAREVAKHLDVCHICQRKVDAWRCENQVLVHCFQDVDVLEFELEDEVLSAPHASRMTAARFGLFVLAFSALLRPFLDALSEFQLPQTLTWLSPTSAPRQFSLLIHALMYDLPPLLTALNNFIRTTSWLAFTTIVLFVMIVLVRRRSRLGNAILSGLAFVTFFGSSSFAMDVRHNAGSMTIPSGETIDDTLVVLGADSVTIEGTVTGDLITAAREVRIRGAVKGNVVSLAERVEVDGTVEGSVFSATGWVENRGKILGNLWACAGNVRITENAQVAGNVTMLAGEGTLEGSVVKDFSAYSPRTLRWGPFNGTRNRINGNDGRFRVTSPAHVGGNLTIRVDREDKAVIDSGATVGKRTNIQLIPPPPSPYSSPSFYIWQTIWLAAAFVAGLLLFWMVPGLGGIALDSSRELLVAGGIGFIATFLTPIAAVIACLTLIGLPLGLILLAAWLTAGYFAKIVIAAFLGRSLLASHGDSKPPMPLLLISGLVPIFVAMNLPYVGGLIGFLLMIVGMGALITTTYNSTRSHRPVHAA